MEHRGLDEQIYEIERKYLLNALPKIPESAEPIRFEQGYLDDSAESEGRIRRAVHPDGTVTCTHTIKRGRGVRRLEHERVIDESEFAALWPQTMNRRIFKTRYRVADDSSPERRRIWEIDVFADLEVILAEVELDCEDEQPAFPEWLAPHVVREVTDEATFQNYALALRAAVSE